MAQLGHVLWRLCEALRVTAILLAPFLPSAARTIIKRLGATETELTALARARYGRGPRFKPQAGAALFPRLAATEHSAKPGELRVGS